MRRVLQIIEQLVLYSLLSTAVCGEGELAFAKAPVPELSAQDQARKALASRFKAERAKAKKPEARPSLAKLYLQHVDSEDDEAMRFVLLTEAVTAAAQGGDLAFALQAAQVLTDRFDVEPFQWKEKAASLVASSTATVNPPQPDVLFHRYIQLAEDAVAAEAYVAAVNIVKSAADAFKKPAYKALKEEALFRVRQLTAARDAFEAAKGSRETLKSDPDDPSANLVWGRFVCFFRQDWDTGLKLMAKGNDKLWTPVARREQAPPATSEDWLQLGDDWWTAGGKERDAVRVVAAERAERAWQRAVDTAPEPRKLDTAIKVDQRIVRLFGPTFALTRGDRGGAVIPGSDNFIPTDMFTIEFWVSTASMTGTLLSKRHISGESTVLTHLDQGIPNLSIAEGSGERGSGGQTAINDERWHHVAIVKTGSEVVLYVDGNETTRTTAESPLLSQSPWKFGCSLDRAGCIGRFGGIRISRVARYDADFTPAKIHEKDLNTLLP